MEDKMEFTGKTVEEATEAGLKELGITAEEAEIKVLEQPTKGLFGKLKGKAVVEITVNPTGEKKALEFVNKTLELLNLTAKAEIVENAEKPTINIIAEKSSSVIGYRGEVLDALQTLAGAVMNIGNKEYKKVVVDCENYRERREETLIALAKKLEEKATAMRRDVILEPMSPFERRIIHTTLANSETVKTTSDGKEPNRYVVIVPNDKDEFSRPYNAGRNTDKGRNQRGGRNDRRDGRRPQRRNGFNGQRKSGEKEERKKSTGFSFGTYLGNSLKDKE